jgi:hypothetical protein
MPRTAAVSRPTDGADHVVRLIRDMRAFVRRLSHEVAFVARSLPWGRVPSRAVGAGAKLPAVVIVPTVGLETTSLRLEDDLGAVVLLVLEHFVALRGVFERQMV